MRYELPLLRGTLLRRYQRFLADVRLDDGTTVTAHCPNPGAMTSSAEAGRPVLLSDHGQGNDRKLRYTWEAIRMPSAWVNVNTARANRVVAEALAAGAIQELRGYESIRPEAPLGRSSRVDFLLTAARRADCYLEVKSATLRVGRAALFPDARSERALRHVLALARLARRGQRAVLLFLVGRADCRWVGPADHVHPEYGEALRRAASQGLEVVAYRARVSPRGIGLGRELPVVLEQEQRSQQPGS
jgi:sugar fermentation stimulation protein A